MQESLGVEELGKEFCTSPRRNDTSPTPTGELMGEATLLGKVASPVSTCPLNFKIVISL